MRRSAALLSAIAGVVLVGTAASAEVVSVIGGTLRVIDPGNGGQSNVQGTFLGGESGLTSELFLDAPTFVGPIFNNKTSFVGETAQIGSFLPETTLFIRNQSFLPSTTGGPASFNFGWFTGDGTLPLNSDQLPHALFTWDNAVANGPVTVSFEDSYGGGDFDFNDAIYQFTNVRVGVVTTVVSPINLNPGNSVTVNAGDVRAFAALSSSFSNGGVVDNNGSIFNYGEAFNTGELNNLANYFNDHLGNLSVAGTVNNTGTFQTAGFVGIETSGVFKNENVAKVVGGLMANAGQWLNTVEAQFENLGGSTVSNSGLMQSLGNAANSGLFEILAGGTVETSGTLTNNGGGTLSIGGGLTNSGNLLNDGQMNVVASAISANAGQWMNAVTGVLENAGLLNNTSDMTNEGLVQNLNQFFNSGALDNIGTWNNGQSSTTTNDGLITNIGSMTVEEGGSITGTGVYEQNGGTTVLNGTMNQFVDLRGGVFKGSGQIEGTVVNSTGGTLSPGNSPGTLSITGSFSLEGGTLEIEVGEAAHDVLAVDGSVFLESGVIAYVFAFTPVNGETFDFLTATGGINGLQNLTFTFTGLDPHQHVDTYLVGFDTLSVEVVPEPSGLAFVALGGGALRRRRRRQGAYKPR